MHLSEVAPLVSPRWLSWIDSSPKGKGLLRITSPVRPKMAAKTLAWQVLALTPSQTLSDHPIFSHTCPLDHFMISQYRRRSADTNYPASLTGYLHEGIWPPVLIRRHFQYKSNQPLNMTTRIPMSSIGNRNLAPTSQQCLLPRPAPSPALHRFPYIVHNKLDISMADLLMASYDRLGAHDSSTTLWYWHDLCYLQVIIARSAWAGG